jgi:superfamily II DNA or RNA helicase
MTVDVQGRTWRIAHQPRDWQVTALAAWNQNSQRGVVEVATGAGKTVFAHLCVLAATGECPNLAVIVLVPTLALLDQWYVSAQDELGVDPREIALYSGKDRPGVPGRFNILVLNTARQVAPTLSDSHPRMLIVDECHRAGGPVNSTALAGHYIATLGLSATPETAYDDAFENRIAPKLGGIIFRYDYQAARRDGVIVPFRLCNVKLPFTSDESERYDSLTTTIGSLQARQRRGEDVDHRLKMLLLRRAGVSASARNRVPVAVQLAVKHAGERSIVFHERIAEAERIHAALKDAGLTVALYHSRMSTALRQSNLRLFRRGGTDVLVTCRALDEGFNVPEAQLAIIASSTASPRQRIQRLGRILRPSRRKDEAVVYTLYATDVEERRLAREAALIEEVAGVSWLQAGPAGESKG